jgi:hypothetical protein
LINHDFPTNGMSLVGVKIGLGQEEGLDGVLDRRYLKHKKYGQNFKFRWGLILMVATFERAKFFELNYT